MTRIKILLHNTETLKSAKGNRDLSYRLNWVLFLTVVLWLSGIMFFVVATEDSKYYLLKCIGTIIFSFIHKELKKKDQEILLEFFYIGTENFNLFKKKTLFEL